MEIPLIIDVRTPGEFEYQHVDGAINVPLANWNKIREVVGEDRHREVWLYCNTGRQSAIAKQMLGDCGYIDIFNYGTIAKTLFAINHRLGQGE